MNINFSKNVFELTSLQCTEGVAGTTMKAPVYVQLANLRSRKLFKNPEGNFDVVMLGNTIDTYVIFSPFSL